MSKFGTIVQHEKAFQRLPKTCSSKCPGIEVLEFPGRFESNVIKLVLMCVCVPILHIVPTDSATIGRTGACGKVCRKAREDSNTYRGETDGKGRQREHRQKGRNEGGREGWKGAEERAGGSREEDEGGRKRGRKEGKERGTKGKNRTSTMG